MAVLCTVRITILLYLLIPTVIRKCSIGTALPESANLLEAQMAGFTALSAVAIIQIATGPMLVARETADATAGGGAEVTAYIC